MDSLPAAGLAMVAAVAAGALLRERRTVRGLRARLAAGETAAAPVADAPVPAERSAQSPVTTPDPSAAPPADPLAASARRAFVSIARRVQGIVHQQLQELREMEERHGADPRVFGDLLRVDHGTALIGRLADSLVVLGGEAPGRQWADPVPVLSVLRGAMSRVIDYRRVDLGDPPDVAVLGRAVEPVAHALAELLDNATRYSPPESRVRLTARPDRGGVVIEVEDSGVGLGAEAARRAARLLAVAQAETASDAPDGAAPPSRPAPPPSPDPGLDFDDLGRSPRLGLTVVGRLARASGFEAALRRAPTGGVRAVLFLPGALIAPIPSPADAAPAPRPEPAPEPAPLRRPSAAEPVPATSPGGLPQRRRRVEPPPAPAPPAPPAAEAGLWLSAFHTGLRGDTPPRKDDEEP